jgi:hypothetical protein
LLARSAAPVALARQIKAYGDPEVTQIRRRGRFAPIPILLNGKVINRAAGVPLKPVPLHYTLLDRSTASDLVPAPLKNAARRAFYERVCLQDGEIAYESLTDLTQPGYRIPRLLFNKVPALGAFASLSYKPRRGGLIQFVLDGVVVAEERKARKGWQGVVSARGLATDLSGFGLVRDRAYEGRIRLLCERLLWAEDQAK